MEVDVTLCFAARARDLLMEGGLGAPAGGPELTSWAHTQVLYWDGLPLF